MSAPTKSPRRLCVFCGSSRGADPAYAAAARDLGEELVARDLGLVYGGGHVGLMGQVADAVMAAGGEVIGVIPQHLVDLEVGHTAITDLRVVSSMHERKKLMADLSGAFVALPGGVGTFEELFEMLTWTQLGIHAKPVGLLDVAGYYAPLLAFLDHAVQEGFIRPQHRSMLHHGTDPHLLLDVLSGWQPDRVEKWVDGR
ncbi:MAG: putative lysine decarboxylase [Acidimicrobiales bacterium]|nr:putative lysine decarboxylase [Acidimicrobiales bacterium]